MPILQCYVCDSALAVLRRVSSEKGRTIEDLAETAIEEAAMDAQTDAERRESAGV